MGIMHKLAFWKKDDFDLGKDTLGLDRGKNLGIDSTGKNLGLDRDTTGLDLNREDSSDLNESDYSSVNSPPGMQRNSFNQPQRPQYAPQSSDNKDLEIISAKLDALKAKMEMIDQRLANIERIAREGV